MYISKLKLINFRNYADAEIEFSKEKNILYGKNGQGKTNIIEALYFLQSGRSFRSSHEKELIKFDSEYARIEAEFVRDGKRNNAVFFLNDKKSIKLNGIVVDKLSELFGAMNIVIFTPDHLNLIKEGPSERRLFLDNFISQIKPSYFQNLLDYYKVLRHRNALLRTTNTPIMGMVEVLSEQLSELSKPICEMRETVIDRFNEYLNNFSCFENDENIKLSYIPSLKQGYDSKETVLNQIMQGIYRDLEYRVTLLGPHRDDFEIFMNGKNIKKFGSQGQQRSCVLKLKLSECEIIKEKTGEMPCLLLDDILSELDDVRRHSFIENIKDRQVIISCTDKEFLKNMPGRYFKIENGQIG